MVEKPETLRDYHIVPILVQSLGPAGSRQDDFEQPGRGLGRARSMEGPMSSSSRWGDDLEQVARSFLTFVRLNGRYGAWVPGIEAFNAAIEECCQLPWVLYTSKNPKGRIAITSVIERLMETEFTDIEREKRGSTRSARVFFRMRIRDRDKQPVAPIEPS
jgi:hypothetical protein